jgi:hypothetical protein
MLRVIAERRAAPPLSGKSLATHSILVNLAQIATSKMRMYAQGASNAHASIWKKVKTSGDNRHQTSTHEIDVRRIDQGSGEGEGQGEH